MDNSNRTQNPLDNSAQKAPLVSSVFLKPDDSTLLGTGVVDNGGEKTLRYVIDFKPEDYDFLPSF